MTALAAALDAAGIAAGDRVAILSENRPEWAITDYAAVGLGAIDVPIYPTLPANQVEYILRDCEAKIVFVSTPAQAAKIQEIRADLPELRARDRELRRRVSAGTTDLRVRSWRTGSAPWTTGRFAGFRAARAGRAARRRGDAHLHQRDHGQPQGGDAHALEPGQQRGRRALQHGLTEVIQKGDTTLSFLPLSHVFERMVDYLYWDVGASIAYAESMDKVADNLGEVRPMIAVSVPRLFEKIYSRVVGVTGVKRRSCAGRAAWARRWRTHGWPGARPGGALMLQYRLADRLVFSKLRERTGGRLRNFVSGGAPLSAEVAKFFFAAGLPVFEGYGLTETSPVIAVNKPDAVKLGTVGKPIPGVEVRIDPPAARS